MKAYITTCLRPDESLKIRAKHISDTLNLPFIERRKTSVQNLQKQTRTPILVVGKERLELFPLDSEEPLFFHPSSSLFRMKRLDRLEKDSFIEISGLSTGDALLDCTLGLASDSLVAAYWVGSAGKVVGLEANPLLAYIVNEGLQCWPTDYPPLQSAMNKVQVMNFSYEDYLRQLPDHSYDCVYFDPMFEHSIEESEVMRNWGEIAKYSHLNKEVIEEAKRVAKKRVVLKAHYKSQSFEELGFKQMVRKSAKFHFGYIETI